MMAWLVAFTWTYALELPVHVALLRHKFRAWWAPCVLALAVNAATHPALWFLAPRFDPYAAWVAVMEVAVALLEAALIAVTLRVATGSFAVRRALLVSVVANALSLAVGLGARTLL